MRTTLTLDDDVAVLVERIRKQRNVSLKDVVNEGLRLSLSQMLTAPKKPTPYRTPTVDAGRCLIGNVDNVAEALALGEGEWYR